MFATHGGHITNFLALALLASHLAFSTPVYNGVRDPVRYVLFLRFAAWACVALSGYILNESSSLIIVLGAWLVSYIWNAVTSSLDILPSPSERASDSGPWFLPCRTSHARQFPQRHSFSYSYLQVGFKVGLRSSGRLLSIDHEGSNGQGRPWTWFNVSDEDYLSRGQHPDGLLGKLREYLSSEGVEYESLPNVYLVTAPRFLGYSFNPVSFWYLYDKSMRLRCMILEVNNTFDERRMYLLSQSSDEEASPSTLFPSETDPSSPRPFKRTWPKDFHVSPFNSRKGSYSLVAHDPCWTHSSKAPPRVDNTITLRSSKDHAKLVARLFSTSPARHVDAMTARDTAHFILAWCWVGFVTFPRILYEAARLFFRRRLHVWFRPEVLRQSIGRTETEREVAVARVFGGFVASQGRRYGVEIEVSDTIARSSAGGSVKLEGKGEEKGKADSNVKMHINSPLFFAEYARDPSYVARARSLPQEQRLFSIEGDISDADLKRIFEGDGSGKDDRLSAWTSLSLLRRLKTFFRRQAFHPMDSFVWRHLDERMDADGISAEKALAYRHAVRGLLLSDVLALGSPELMDACGWAVRTFVGWRSMQACRALVSAREMSVDALRTAVWTGGFVYTALSR